MRRKKSYHDKIKRPVKAIIPILDKPLHFDSIYQCGKFLMVDKSDVRKALLWGGTVKGMRIVE